MNFQLSLRELLDGFVTKNFIICRLRKNIFLTRPLVYDGLLFYRCISRKIYIFVSL